MKHTEIFKAELSHKMIGNKNALGKRYKRKPFTKEHIENHRKHAATLQGVQ